jgi:hypothetical protein
MMIDEGGGRDGGRGKFQKSYYRQKRTLCKLSAPAQELSADGAAQQSASRAVAKRPAGL